ncbi:hypothetical protein BT96DRAFT_1019381 [Gymnopus androsaceus JB14]|uniref:Uncharacterized protein n=1 Tax=Gymnopus androsaceus JB14 TaxID=1447944 RepID=A0A6A4HNC3_9AGAR|nr:hypothetical protein BT96DRAFT_1019381 [Gymnopus androsaceus JB14]
MPTFFSTVSLFFLFTCINLGLSGSSSIRVGASPIQGRNEGKPPAKPYNAIDEFDDLRLLGMRYVSEPKAKEYNEYGYLTAIPATATSIGEGAYLSPKFRMLPSAGGLPVDPSYMECVAAASEKALKTVPMIYVKPTEKGKSPTYHSPVELAKYLQNAGKTVKDTLLFSIQHSKKVSNSYQLLIPPKYLPESKLPLSEHAEKPVHGTNSLGIKAFCAPLGCLENLVSAHWDKWTDPSIPDWPADIKLESGTGTNTPKPANCPPVPAWVAAVFVKASKL